MKRTITTIHCDLCAASEECGKGTNERYGEVRYQLDGYCTMTYQVCLRCYKDLLRPIAKAQPDMYLPGPK